MSETNFTNNASDWERLKTLVDEILQLLGKEGFEKRTYSACWDLEQTKIEYESKEKAPEETISGEMFWFYQKDKKEPKDWPKESDINRNGYCLFLKPEGKFQFQLRCFCADAGKEISENMDIYCQCMNDFRKKCELAGWHVDGSANIDKQHGGLKIIICEFNADSASMEEFVKNMVDWDKNSIGKFNGYRIETIEEGKNLGDKKMNDPEKQKEEIKELLLNNHNIILHGAPGTGKTYLAKQIAKDLIFTKEEHDLVDRKESEITDTDREKYENLKEQFDKRCGFVQFHQSYDYTDFVEGLRPIKKGTEIGFELRPGVFKDFCKDALEKMNEAVTVSIAGESREIKKPFIFIIDEINRGEMSKIFGELFYSIDPGYRVKNEDFETGKKPFTIRTQYSNLQDKPNEFDKKLFNINESVESPEYKEKIEKYKDDFGHFFVPENVYIIGTMNDIDRSVESMDFAMRRRFAFEEISAEDRVKMLFDEDNGLGKNAEEAKDRMEKLNKDIKKIDGLSSAYHIGPAYFLKLKNYKGNFDLLWEYHIEGVVKEYLRGMDNAKDSLKNLAEAYGYSNLEKYDDGGLH